MKSLGVLLSIASLAAATGAVFCGIDSYQMFKGIGEYTQLSNLAKESVGTLYGLGGLFAGGASIWTGKQAFDEFKKGF